MLLHPKIERLISAVFGRKSKNASHRSSVSIGWRFIFGIMLFALIIIGINPAEIFTNPLQAIKGQNQIIRLYANESFANSADDDFRQGWWNINNSIGKPDLSETDSFLKFSDKNSAFYSKGRFNLEIGSFLPNKDEFIIDAFIEKQDSQKPESVQAKNQEEQAGVEIIEEIIDDSNIQIEDNTATPSPRTEDDEETRENSIDVIEASEDREAQVIVEEIKETSEEAKNKGEFKQDHASSSQAIESANPTASSAPAFMEQSENSANEKASNSREKKEEDGGEISILNKFKALFSRPIARAQEMVVDKINGLSGLGEFKQATIKFSLALNSRQKENAASNSAATEEQNNSQESELSDEQGAESMEQEENSAEQEAGNMEQESGNMEQGQGEVEIIEIDDQNENIKMQNIEEAGSMEHETNNTEQEENNAEHGTENTEHETGNTKQEPSNMEQGQDEVDKISMDWIYEFINIARAQDSPGDAKLVVWYTTDPRPKTAHASGSPARADGASDQRLWQKLDTISAGHLSNAVNNGYLSYEAPFLSGWEDVENLSIKVEGLIGEDSISAVYLDSVWVEAEYEPGEAVEKIKRQNALKNALKLLSEKLVFKVNEGGELKFRFNKEEGGLWDSFSSWLGASEFWDNIDIKTKIVDSRAAAVDVDYTMIMENNGEFTIKLPEMPDKLKPGDYKIMFVIIDTSGSEEQRLEFEQDFSWGVLAINTNKSVYTPLENAYLQMAVLDERGHTLCGADLELEITAPYGTVKNFSTLNGSIVKNPLCGPDNVIDTPDYYANYIVAGEGRYKMRLTASTTNGIKELWDEFEVRDRVPFDIERVGPTRIYPVADYDMELLIKFNQDFSGDLIERIPSDFKITNYKLQITNNIEYPISNIKTGDGGEIILSDLELEAGQEVEFSYTFDAPDVSPEFYLLGEARLEETKFLRSESDRRNLVSFSEARQWQIAADLPFVATSTNGSATGWTDFSYAWDNGVNTYATRVVPRKTGSGGEPANYIRSSTSTARNLNGDITQVEIGLEGRVENANASFWVQPYFNGSTAGAALALALGTTDDNSGHYVDITNDTARLNYPDDWTWQEIMDLDINIYGANTSNSKDYTVYVDQIMIQVQYTPNTAPTSTIESAAQKKDDSGAIDVWFSAWDSDLDASRARLEYESGSDCGFVGASKATIDDTDANATSSVDDVAIDNDSYYQIGTSTGKITMASGTNNVYIDWLSASDINGEEGAYCLGLTINDYETDQSPIATATVTVDNKAPSAPGSLSEWGTTTKDTISLSFGSTSSDMHFREYIIYYSTSTPPTENDYSLSSSTDENLGDINFLSATTTSATGLLENTTYYFAIWAYDSYGHKSSSSPVTITTNKTADAEFNKTVAFGQKSDGSGYVDLAFDVRDINSHPSTAKIEYEAGDGCLFGGSGDPTLDSSISATLGAPAVNNSLEYQIRNITTSATNTVQFDWLSQTDADGADNTYCFRLTVNDGRNDNTPVFATTTIDNLDPSAPGAISEVDTATSSITLFFGATSTETNFSYYKIYYKAGTSGVTEGESGENEVNDNDLNNKYFNYTSTTTITVLNPDTNYVFKVWAYDVYGNKASSAEAVIKTAASIQNTSLTFVDPEVGNIGIGNGESEYTFRAVVSEENGWTTLDSVVLRLADKADNVTPFDDLKFTWSQSSESFTDNSADAYGAVALSNTSTSTCSGNTCTLDFNLVFNYDFASSAVNYAAELLSANDSASYDFDTYTDFYEIQILNISQIHYRWRNDDGGE
ncbi:MAG: hypothetical protein U9R06_00620 [Patescibacteria group bacterium]|nr:hypothetical protein [Patescibacteria group bacterium]